jgi:hypothetical protein
MQQQPYSRVSNPTRHDAGCAKAKPASRSPLQQLHRTLQPLQPGRWHIVHAHADASTAERSPTLQDHAQASTAEPTLQDSHAKASTAHPTLQDDHAQASTAEPTLQDSHPAVSTAHPTLQDSHAAVNTAEQTLQESHAADRPVLSPRMLAAWYLVNPYKQQLLQAMAAAAGHHDTALRKVTGKDSTAATAEQESIRMDSG